MTKSKAEERSTPFLGTATEGSTARTTDPLLEIAALWGHVEYLDGALRRLTMMLQAEPELRIDYQKVMEDA